MAQQGTTSGSSQSTPQPDAQQPQAESPAVTVPEEKAGYASELLAYRVVDNISDVIANQVSHKLRMRNEQARARLLLVSDLEQALGGMPLGEIRGQTSLMEGAFKEREREHKRLLESPAEERAIEESVTGVATLITAIGGITGTLPDALALFRSDYKITERDFDVKDPAVFSSVVGNLARKGFTIFIPGFYSSEGSKILSKLADLSQQAAHLKTQRDALALLLPKSEEKEEPDKPDASRPKLSEGRRAEVAAAVLKTDATLLSFEGFRTSWTTLPQGQTQTKLEKALVRERIDKLGITHLLWLGNLSSGGEATVRNSFPRRGRIGFMGGAAISFVLADKRGKVLDGNTYAQYGITGGKLDDYVGRNPAEVRYPLEYPRKDFDVHYAG